MPLFIDLHIDHNLTPDLVKQCHVADKAVQEKYGVQYLQILLNQPQGYLFCLIEGPDKEACAKVHQEAHGNIACNILEITESDFSALLANKQKNSVDFTLNRDGSLDTGNRAILAVELLGSPETYRQSKETIIAAIGNKGLRFEGLSDKILFLFDTCSSALESASEVRRKITDSAMQVELRMGVSLGLPLHEKGTFFEDARRSANHFSFISGPGEICTSSKVQELCGSNPETHSTTLKVVSPVDEKFLNQLMECTEKIWDQNAITIVDFAREMGMSKSQLTRRLKQLTSFSPNDFLKEFRLRKAIRMMMEDDSLNIAEVTMAIGFTNPSYFTKCFRERFGKVPSDYMLAAS